MTAQPHQLEAVPEQFRALVPDHGKSPWHPSAKATKRVPDPFPVPTVHDCGNPIEIAHHSQVYGREFSDWPWMYRCQACDATVGMHPFTCIPLGTLANKALRLARSACKQPFEMLWHPGTRDRRHDVHMSRDEAYAELAVHLGISIEQCHFGLFDVDQCKAARVWAVQRLRQPRPRAQEKAA